MLKSSSMGVTVIMCVTLPKLPARRSPPGGGSGRKGRRPVECPGLPRTAQDWRCGWDAPASIGLKVGARDFEELQWSPAMHPQVDQ